MSDPPYGKSEIGLVEPGPGESFLQVLDEGREARLAGRRPESYQGAPPVKPAPWPYRYIPVYFWVGGITAGSWIAVTAEDLVGEGDTGVIRAGRYLAVGGVVCGTALLIMDLGRMERFHHMLRVIRPRSPMNLGTWTLTAFGPATGAAAVLQAVEDRRSDERPLLGRLLPDWTMLSRRSVERSLAARPPLRGLGRVVHLAGLPCAVLGGTYTGVLLSATATPSWARAWLTLGPLSLASGLSTGLAAISLWVELDNGASEAAKLRLARAEVAVLAAEVALLGLKGVRVRQLRSYRQHPVPLRIARAASVLGGLVVPLALNLWKVARAPDSEPQAPSRGGLRDPARLLARTPLRGRRARLRAKLADRDSATSLLAAGLVLAGGLALRLVIQHEGTRSAKTPADTWEWAARGRERGLPPHASAGAEP